MKKSTVVKTAALAAAGIAGWYFTGNSRKGQVEKIRREVYRLLNVRRDELEALRDAAKNGELAADALGPVPLDGAELDAVSPAGYGYAIEGSLGAVTLNGETAQGLEYARSENPDADTFYPFACSVGSIEADVRTQ